MIGKHLLEEVEKLRPGAKLVFMSGYTVNVIAHQGGDG
jgi:hypothetical protein